MKHLTIFLSLILIGFSGMAQEQLMLENASKKSFDETVTWIEKTATDHDWKVIAIHDLQASMTKNGYEVLPVKVFALCKPEHAYKVLGKDNERIVSSMMPCRVSVYEKSDGKTYISRMNTKLMAGNFEGAVKEVMTVTTDEIEELLKPLLK
jgi:uncharacterized protein (DUF302 family)